MKRSECRKLSPAECAAQLPADRYFVAIERGQLEVGLYAPEGTDPQQPHGRDECYVILEGEGRFRMGDETVSFRPGDFLFRSRRHPTPVPRLRRFVQGLGVFYGPEGGEEIG